MREKHVCFALLAMAAVFAVLAACGKGDIVTLSDDEYDKMVNSREDLTGEGKGLIDKCFGENKFSDTSGCPDLTVQYPSSSSDGSTWNPNPPPSSSGGSSSSSNGSSSSSSNNGGGPSITPGGTCDALNLGNCAIESGSSLGSLTSSKCYTVSFSISGSHCECSASTGNTGNLSNGQQLTGITAIYSCWTY